MGSVSFLVGSAIDVPHWLLRRLAELAGADLEGISWDSSAFDSLVIPEDKEIIQSLIENHATGSNGKPFDLIHGRGQSLVILLHHVPHHESSHYVRWSISEQNTFCDEVRRFKHTGEDLGHFPTKGQDHG
jgi:hypothetical protein